MSRRSIMLSVLIPVLNGRKYLREAVISILADKTTPLEILLHEDGSHDPCADSVSDLPVEWIPSAPLRGLGHSRNELLKHAKGKYIAFFDQDDLMHPEAMRTRVNYLETHPNESAVMGVFHEFIDENGFPLEAAHELATRQVSTPRLSADSYYPKAIWLYLFRKEVFEDCGTFDPQWQWLPDDEFLERLISRDSLPVLPVPVASYRIHDTNATVFREAGSRSLNLQVRPGIKAEAVLLQLKQGRVPCAINAKGR